MPEISPFRFAPVEMTTRLGCRKIFLKNLLHVLKYVLFLQPEKEMHP